MARSSVHPKVEFKKRTGCNSTHGESGKDGSPEYRTWTAMLDRCLTRSSSAYARYGGRGITICKRWRRYENFLADMGRKPTPLHTLDRIENSKGYCPSNCRWATRRQQMRNTTRAVRYAFRGERLLLIEWAEKLDIPVQTLRTRLRDGWTVQDTLSKPNDCQNTYLEHNGKRLTIAQWSKAVCLKPATICQRLKRGWSVKRTLETPVS
jgi:hypothetical protein